MPFKTFFISFKNELIALVTIFISFTSEIQGLFLIVGMAVFLDTFYAIYATIRLKGIEFITSHKLFNSAVKTFFYMGTIIMAYLTSLHITDGQLFKIEFFLPKFICGFWLFIELKSIDETNIKLGNSSFLDNIKSIIKWLKEFKEDVNEIKK